MTFDVALLTERAEELKQVGIDAAYREMTRFGGGSPYILSAAEDSMAGVESIYDDFLDVPAPEDFAHWTQRLGDAMGKVATEGRTSDPITGSNAVSGHNDNLTLIGSSGDYLSDWTGRAADAYKTDYGDKFVPTASSQYAAISVLRNAINAEAAVWQGVRDDLDALSQQAIDYMREAGNKGGAEWAAVLSIAAAVIAVPVTGGASAIAIPAVAAGLSVAATGIGLAAEGEGAKDHLGLQAGSSDEVLASLQEALSTLKTHLIEQEDKIRTAMNDSTSAVDGDWDLFCLPQPALADAPQYPVNEPDMAGVSE